MEKEEYLRKSVQREQSIGCKIVWDESKEGSFGAGKVNDSSLARLVYVIESFSTNKGGTAMIRPLLKIQ